jgi:serine/threonine-protein kinase
VRITPQLIRVSDDTHLWSEPFDRILEDIFAVQAEIADRTIQQLGIALKEPERQALAQKPTENLLAYEIYLRGLDHLKRPSSQEEDFRQAERMFQQACELDPNFTLAFVRLSEVHCEYYFWWFDRTEARQTKARMAVERALELEPNLPEAHRALGAYYYMCFFDYDSALQEFAIAAKGLPNDPELLESIAYIWRRQGLWEDAITNLHRAANLDPQNAWLRMQLGLSYLFTREYTRSDGYFRESIALEPDQTMAYAFMAFNQILRDGDLQKSRLVLTEVPDQKDPFIIAFWFWREMYARDYQAALDRLSGLPEGIAGGTMPDISKDLLAGTAYQAWKQYDQARASFESAREILENFVAEQPKNGEGHSSLGRAYAGLGRKEEALRQGLKGVELLIDDAMRVTGAQEDLAKIYTMLGEQDKALDILEHLLSTPAFVSVPLLRLDPNLDPLRDNPRFQRLVGEDSLQ